MSESVEESEELTCSGLINEIVNLRQHANENKTLSALVTLYKNQISGLEVELSDLKAQLMAKDFELYSLTQKLNSKSSPFFTHSLPFESANSDFKLDQLMALLSLEKEKSLNYERQIRSLQAGFNPVQTSELNGLEDIVKRLMRENEELKGKLAGEDHSTAHKTLNTSEVKSFSIYVESENDSIAESTPRAERSLAEISPSTKFLCNFPVDTSQDPKPPKTRCRSDCPQRLVPNDNVKYVFCNLTEILNQPFPSPKQAGFYPSSLRKFK